MMSRAAILLLAASGAARTVAGQASSCVAAINGPKTAGQSLAERYAPIYLPMREELYLPTLPFFTAFEDRGALGGMADTSEIARMSPHDASRLDWDHLNRRYIDAKLASDTADRDRDSAFVFSPFVISYHVRRLPAEDQASLWRFLRDDEQAWKRIRWLYSDLGPQGRRSGHLWTLDSVEAEMRRHRQGFTVLQYYAYYLSDVGLEGHASDLEPVVVFVPDSVPASRVNERGFRIVVGVGHTNYVPNGVAVLLGDQAQDPDETNAAFRYRPHILIEFGDHSSAPDLPPYGAFQPGWDVNWHIRFVWGTRDVQASHGTGYVGSYELGMTFPRDTARQLRPNFLGASAERKAKKHFPYALIRVALLQCLYQTLETLDSLGHADASGRGRRKAPTVSDLTPLVSVLKRLERELPTWNIRPYITAFDTVAGGDAEALARFTEVAFAMTRWTADLRTAAGDEIENSKLRAWEHHLYRDPPAKAFKAHLFRPTTNGLAGPGFGGWLHAMIPHPTFGLMSAGRYRIGLGVTIPAIESPLSLPGVIELNGGVYGTLFDGLIRRKSEDGDTTRTRNWQFATWVTYEDDYGDQLTWFVQLFKVWRRRSIDPDRSSWQVEGGVSFGLNSDPKTRLRIGPRLDLSSQLNLDWVAQFTWVR